MKNRTYNALKFIALVALPAIGTLYFTVAGMWGLPDADKVVGTITAIDTFLGVVLHISSKVYKPAVDGNLVIDDSVPGKIMHTLQVFTPIEELPQKDAVTLRVSKPVAEAPVDGPAMPS